MESTICTVNQLLALTALSANIDPQLLVNWLFIVQQRDIQGILGDSLYQDICTRFDANTLTGDTGTLYNEYIVPSIGFSAWEASSVFLAYHTNRNGINTTNSPDSVPATPEELSMYNARVLNLKNFYLNRLNDYLIQDSQSASPKFPLFRSNNHVPEQNQKGGTLYLGFKRKTLYDNGGNSWFL